MRNLATIIALMSLVACSKSKPQHGPQTEGGIKKRGEEQQKQEVVTESAVSKKIAETLTVIDEQVKASKSRDAVEVRPLEIKDTDLAAVSINAFLQDTFNQAIEKQDNTIISMRLAEIEVGMDIFKGEIQDKVKELNEFALAEVTEREGTVTAEERESINLVNDILLEVTLHTNLKRLNELLLEEYESSHALPEQQRNERGLIEAARAQDTFNKELASKQMQDKMDALSLVRGEVIIAVEKLGAKVDLSAENGEYVTLDVEALVKAAVEVEDVNIALDKLTSLEEIANANAGKLTADIESLSRLVKIKTSLELLEVSAETATQIDELIRLEASLVEYADLSELKTLVQTKFDEATTTQE
jgi:hypothetical protein